MFNQNPIPDELIRAIKQARQIRQIDVNYSNGSTPHSPSWDRLSELVHGVEDDPHIRRLIQFYRETGRLPE